MTLREKLLSDRARLVEKRAEDPEDRALTLLANDYTAKGLGRSGALLEARHERRLETVRDVLAERLRLERDEPLGSADATSWYDALVANVREIAARGRERLLGAAEVDWTRGLGGTLPDEVRRKFEDQLEALEAEYLEEALLLRQERWLPRRVREERPTMVTININQSQVAALNVGHIVGDIQAVVSGLNGAGHREVAEALKNLTEAIDSNPALGSTERRDAFELTSAFADELQKPQGEKRPSVLRLAATQLRQVLSAAGDAARAYELLKTAAAAAGLPFDGS